MITFVLYLISIVLPFKSFGPADQYFPDLSIASIRRLPLDILELHHSTTDLYFKWYDVLLLLQYRTH